MKIIIYCFVVVALIGAYLILAHYYFFYKIISANLKMPEAQDVYTLGDDKNATKNLLYVALGDSLTAGVGVNNYQESYPYVLAEKLAAGSKNKITLKNYSYAGAKTDDLIRDLLVPAIGEKPDIITLFIGTNDVYGRVSTTSFRKNYQNILDQLTKNTKAKIYIINLPQIGSSKLLLPPYNFYYNWRVRKFNEIIKELATNYQVKYLDLAAPALVQFEDDQTNYSADLFHPSANGYKIWAKIIYDDINK